MMFGTITELRKILVKSEMLIFIFNKKSRYDFI